MGFYDGCGGFPEDRPRQVVRAEPEHSFKDTKILGTGARASDADRDATVLHLREALDAGYLDPCETQTRIGHALEAKTKSELGALTRDIHPRPVKARRIPELSKTARMVLVLCGWAFASLMALILPFALTADEKVIPALQLAFIIPFTVAGGISLLAALIWGINQT